LNTFRRHIFIIFLLCFFIGCSKEKKRHIDYSHFSPTNDLALNRNNAKFPSAIDSDDGWGGAYHKSHLNDGIRHPEIYWNYGYAFTGGYMDYVDTCGWRKAVIDFGKPISFNRVVIWRNVGDDLPANYLLQYIDSNNTTWLNAKKVDGGPEKTLILKKQFIKDFTNYIYVWATEDTFNTVTSNKFRLYLNNCSVDVIWLTEIEIYNDKPNDRPFCLIIK